jgi:putative PIN family toxin of toxin-antitoxin system
MIYAVIDTNVFVSALLSHYNDTATVRVVSAISKMGLCPLYNEEIVAEYEDVLNRPKFHFPSQAIAAILNKVLDAGISTNRTYSSEHFPDPKDVVFYEVALSKEEAFLVTGNKKHFPQKPIVVTPAEMLEILKREGIL